MIPLFMHIPKAGGTALKDWLYISFRGGAEWESKFYRQSVYYYPAGYVYDTPGESFAQIMRTFRDPDLRAVIGHFRWGIHEQIPQPSAYVTVLRNPVERIVSLYAFHRLVQDRKGSLDWVVLPDGMTLGDFADTPPYPEADNGMVRRLSGFAGEIGGCTRDHLELAKERLAGFGVVGVLHRLDAAVEAIKSTFGAETDTPLYVKNDNPTRRALSVSAADTNAITECNRLDVELYEFACRDLLANTVATSTSARISTGSATRSIAAAAQTDR